MDKRLGKTTEDRKTYKPFWFDFAYKACETQHQAHWLPYEIDLTQDVQDFNRKMTDLERSIITKVLRFFTQTDLEIARAYVDYYLPIFKCPEVRMMLTSFANMETLHVISYAYLNTSLHIPDEEYATFLKHKEMMDKYDYMHSFDPQNPESIALTLAVFSGFIEGVVLFSSFAILLYLALCKNLLKGVGQIISFSIRDEVLHSTSVIQLYHCYLAEHPEIDIKVLHEKIYKECEIVINLEINFINLIFAEGELDNFSKKDLIDFVYYLRDIKLINLGLKPLSNITTNPLHWMEKALLVEEYGNFFETSITTYAKGSYQQMKDEPLVFNY